MGYDSVIMQEYEKLSEENSTYLKRQKEPLVE